MKTIYLVRHSEPLRLPGVPNAELPLSPRGHRLAEELFGRNALHSVSRVYASPYRRAMETALHSGRIVLTDERLVERLTGQAAPEMGDCWLRQYEDHGFKCPGGESFDEVRRRMAACLADILAAMTEGERAVVVTHAAAMCAYLTECCMIQVVERAEKVRAFFFGGENVYTGRLPTPFAFKLSFEQGRLTDIRPVE